MVANTTSSYYLLHFVSDSDMVNRGEPKSPPNFLTRVRKVFYSTLFDGVQKEVLLNDSFQVAPALQAAVQDSMALVIHAQWRPHWDI
jgi:hypothetical protein